MRSGSAVGFAYLEALASFISRSRIRGISIPSAPLQRFTGKAPRVAPVAAMAGGGRGGRVWLR